MKINAYRLNQLRSDFSHQNILIWYLNGPSLGDYFREISSPPFREGGEGGGEGRKRSDYWKSAK